MRLAFNRTQPGRVLCTPLSPGSVVDSELGIARNVGGQGIDAGGDARTTGEDEGFGIPGDGVNGGLDLFGGACLPGYP